MQRPTRLKKRQAGFTLIEIAIVLVIIGLLLGGVLKGQELINSARVKSYISDFRNIQAALYGYQDRFRAVPGDDQNAEANVNAAAGHHGNGDGRIDGTWNAVAYVAGEESFMFWEHVRRAGLLGGNFDAGPPNTPDTGREFITSTSPIDNGVGFPGNFFICFTRVPARFARQIDTTLDDGNTHTGAMRASLEPAGGGAPAAASTQFTAADDGGQATVCLAF